MRKETVAKEVTKVCLSVLFCLLAAYPARGQALSGKRTLTEADYKLWSTPELGDFSTDGKWLSYTLHYEQGQDTLFVRATDSQRQFIIPGAVSGKFHNNYFAAIDKGSELHLIHLDRGSRNTYDNVQQYWFTSEGNLVLVSPPDSAEKQVTILDGNAEVRWSDKASTVTVDPSGRYAVLTTKDIRHYTLEILRLKDLKTVFRKKSKSDEFVNVTWNKKASALVYMRRDSINGKLLLECYDLETQQLSELGSQLLTGLKGQALAYTSLTVSDDGTAIFFKVRDTACCGNDAGQGPLVWNTGDKWLYPKEKNIQGWKAVDKVCVWYPGQQQKILQVTDSLLPRCFLSGDYRYAVLYNPQTYEPQTELQAKTDYYIMDLRTGKRLLLLRKHSGSPLHLMALPGTSALVYFSKKHWWSYNPADGTHYNITAGLPQIAATTDMQEESPPYGSPYKVAGEDRVVLPASDGIWSAGLFEEGLQRLTPPDKDMQYRIVAAGAFLGKQGNLDGITTAQIIPGKTVYIAVQALDGSASGYGRWYQREYRELLYSPFSHSDLAVCENSGTLAYLVEDYNRPPEIKLLRTGKEPETLVTTNTQHYRYQWGHSELIHYRVGDKHLSGALYYPAAYDPGLHYPMVVHIYEEQSQAFRDYVNPSLRDACGFNISSLTTRGYFVLLPDIAYSLGKPGLSALNCVMAATDKAVNTAAIDPQRMGLIGHSFGGYQANYIVTHADRFAAAVSGSAVNNLVRGYLALGNYKVPDYWRYEHHQMRMGKPLFKDVKAYLDNSPVFAAAFLNTPLLSWTGDQDYQVDWHQSVEFFLALRRLGKEHTLLLYPGESHALYNNEHKEDLSRRIIKWFDRYLKNSAASQ